MRVNNNEANAILATFADGKQIYYADIGASFLEPDGTISKDVMPDMLHLSARGYRAWADAIASQLEDLTR
jgi:beta-glucosidase